MSEFLRVAKTTISEYMKGEEINILADQKLTAMMMQKKRISYAHEGVDLTWFVRKSRNGFNPYADAGQLTFNRVNRNEKAVLPWRGYEVSEAITEKEKLMNRGKAAMVNYIGGLGEAMRDDIKFGFGGEFYKDGNGGNADTIHGFQSWTGIQSNAQYTLPDDSYAGIVTDLGGVGGAALNSSTWPIGQFDAEYYFWSPLVVNYTHANWSAGTDTWPNTCIEALRLGLLYSNALKGKTGKTDLIITDVTMYGQFLDALDEKERIQVQRDGEKSGLISLGFRDVVNFDGCDITSEYDAPATQGHGINFESLNLCSMNSQLFVSKTQADIDTLADKLVVYFFGNMKGNPRNHLYFDNIT